MATLWKCVADPSGNPLNLTSCEDMVNCFYNTVLPLLDHFMPWVERAQYTTEKPWVSNHFRQLIKRRQKALEQGQLLQYKRLRNKTTSVARSLRKRFYKSQVERLHQSDPRSWWKHTKSFLNLNTSSKQLNPANLHISNDDSLPEAINKFFVRVSSHLPPLSPLSQGHGGVQDSINKNSSGDEIANVNVYAVRPEGTRIR